MFFSKRSAMLRKMGLKTDQNGIIDRYLREKEGWDIHLENCKNFILRSLEYKQAKSVAVLGSGWLLDVPIDELIKKLDKLFLIDIIHPALIKYKTKPHKNIVLIENDITGGAIERAFNFIDKKLYKTTSANYILQNLQPLKLELNLNADLYISLNITNQLDILIVDFLRQNLNFNENDFFDFRKTVQKEHLLALPQNKSCLITDYEEITTNNKNLKETRKLVYSDFPAGNFTEEWQWDFDFQKTYYSDKTTQFIVKAIDF